MNRRQGIWKRLARLSAAMILLWIAATAAGGRSWAAPLQAPLSPWRMTDAMATARGGHSDTLLPDGRVLVVAAGGNATADPAEGSIERYDPVSEAWEALVSLRPPRRGHTATLLPDGRVLIAGGDGGMGQPYPAEALLFDPVDSSLTPTTAMNAPRAFHSATLLADGRVMVLGGGNPGFLDGIEVYDPLADSWTAIGTLTTAREYHTATLLPDGSVLVAGGAGASGRLTSIERVDARGASSVVAQLQTPRGFHSATLLPGGQVLLAGGDGGGGDGFPPRAERYDPQNHAVVETAPMAGPRRHHTATLLPDGRVLVVGGDKNSPLASTEVYDPAADSWSAGPSLNEARRLHTTTLLHDGSLLAAGGYGADGWLLSAERMAIPCEETVEIPVAQAQPDATFTALLGQIGIGPAKLKGLGDATSDRIVAHSFTALQRPGMRIAEATLIFAAEPGAGGTDNDAFHILVARGAWPGSPRIGWYFDSGSGLNGQGYPWGAGDPGQGFVIDLHDEDPALMQALNDDGRLDVWVQDDTTVLRMMLRLRYVCCESWVTHPAPASDIGPELDARLTDIGLPPGSRKGFGDLTSDRAVAHSFQGIGIPGTQIAAAELTVLARPWGSGPDNDAIFALVAGGLAPPQQRWFFDAGQASPNLGYNWMAGLPAQSITMVVDDPAVLAAMNATGRLDVYAQDDTTIYGLRLRTYHACCGEWTDLARESDAEPSPELLQFLDDGGFPALKGYGDGTSDQVFADSFVGLQRPGMHISAFELVMHGTQGGNNDTVSALVAGASPAARINWWLASNWLAGQGRTPVLSRDLSQSYTLFEALNQTGRLDIYVQDDGRVDSLELRLYYDCGPMPPYLEPGPKEPPSSHFIGQPQPDLWIDDTPYTVDPNSDLDTGLEPVDWGMDGQPLWQSRAIWVRNAFYDTNDPHAACANTEPQNPMSSGSAITVCVRVENIGQMPATGTLHLYWAKAALGLGWNAVPGSEPGTTNGDWTEIGATAQIDLDPGQSTVIGLPWVPPDTSPEPDLHACLLARIEALAPDAIWDETTDVVHNTRHNNNIAWRNVQVEGLIVGSIGRRHPVILRNLSDEAQEMAVRIRPVVGLAGADFFETGRLDLDMPAAIGDPWKALGGPGRGFLLAPDGTGVIVQEPGSALIEGLVLAPREAVELGLRFRLGAASLLMRADGASQTSSPDFDVEVVQLVRDEDGSLREQGGVAYAFRQPDSVPPSVTPTPTGSPSPQPTAAPSLTPAATATRLLWLPCVMTGASP